MQRNLKVYLYIYIYIYVGDGYTDRGYRMHPVRRATTEKTKWRLSMTETDIFVGIRRWSLRRVGTSDLAIKLVRRCTKGNGYVASGRSSICVVEGHIWTIALCYTLATATLAATKSSRRWLIWGIYYPLSKRLQPLTLQHPL